ncbi:MAG: NAD(P)/FAD-dependent oxidoreductase [Nitrospinota bacterium]|nr:NAD(P)/FAD-dependent oxidoreductase [Nitrospinota bacterium]
MEYDVVVVGGGLGGLTAGALLAREGKKVLLLERHYRPGGCATVFRRGDYQVEVGLHELDGLHEEDFKRELFLELKVFDHVEFIRLPQFYRFVNGRVDVTVPEGYNAAIHAFVSRFPDEEKGIRKFFAKIRAIGEEAAAVPKKGIMALLALPLLPLLYPNLVFNMRRPLGAYVDSLFQDGDLKLALLANLGYYHDDPYSASMLYYSIAQMSYMKGGGHFIKGGSQNLSDYLASIIRDNGGEVKLRHQATKIVMKDGKASGVEYIRVSGERGKVHTAECRAVAANASIPDVVNKLAPEAFREEYSSRINSMKAACSFFCVYIGFNKTPKEMGNPAYSTFVLEDSVKSLKDLYDPEKLDMIDKGYVFVDYSQIDSGLAPEGKSLGVIVSADYLSRWEGLSREMYQTKKKHQMDNLLNRLEKLIPGAREHIEYMEASTPVTMKRFTANPGGAAYGFAQVPGQAGLSRLPNKSPVENLYYCSAWGMPGGGFSGAIFAGRDCARKISRKLGG